MKGRTARRQKIGLVAGPLLFGGTFFLPIPLPSEGVVVLATTLLMATWWICEALPIAATALLPLVVFPLFGVVPAATVSTAYMDPNIVLFMGGFFLAMSIQKWDLHRRIALAIIALIGGNLKRLVLGFMLSSAFISMWVSNTATAIMMLPIGTAVILQLQRNGLNPASRFAPALMLSIAYACSIGGVATLIGTPPNIVLASQYAELFPDRAPITFLEWMEVGVPFAALFLPIAWIYLTSVYGRLGKERVSGGANLIAEERARLGPMSRGEKGVTAIFLLTALGWIFRADIALGALTIPGWATLLGVERYAHDSTVAIFSAILLFSIPVNWKAGEFLLDWEWARRIPWNILILFGGGIALAGAFQTTGLARWVGDGLTAFAGVPTLLLVVAICLTITFLTEVTSNTATATLFLPILGGMAGALQMPPELLMIPATISASCAFMLPVATPPNAIVFGSEHLTVPLMARAGIWMNLMGILITTLVVYLIVGF